MSGGAGVDTVDYSSRTAPVTVDQSIVIQGLALGGNIVTSNSLTVNAAFSWTGGQLGGTATTLLNGAGTASTGATHDLGGVVTVGATGSLTVTGGVIRSLAGGSGLAVQAGGLLDLQADGAVLSTFNAGTLTNAGTLRRSTGTGVGTVVLSPDQTTITVNMSFSGLTAPDRPGPRWLPCG